MKIFFTKFRCIIIVFLIVLILTVSYSVYIYQFQNNDFVYWLNTLISTIISVSLALIIAIYIFYYQTSLIQKDTKNKFIPLIEGDLIDIWTGLFDLQYPMKIKFNDGKIFCVYLDIFDDIIYEQAICSNVFNKEETRFLLEMKVKIKYHNSINERFINLYTRCDESPDKYRKSLEFLYNNYNKSRNELKSTILSANKYFKFKELDKEIKQNSSNA